jgi:hypothetical protein
MNFGTMPDNQHRYLKNEPKTSDGFKKTRGFKPSDPEEEEPLSKIISGFQKERLRRENGMLFSQRRVRAEERTITIAQTIDLVRIRFFVIFNFDLQKKFFERYGLSAVEFTDFNL